MRKLLLPISLLALLLLASSATAAWMPSSKERGSAIWAVGDGGPGADSIPTKNLLLSRSSDYFFYLGDVYETGTAADFQNNYGFSALSAITAPTIGNHESANRSAGYYPFWASLRGSAPPPYYSFWVSGWQVLVLSSEDPLAAGSAQYSWLRSRLRAYPGQRSCRIILTHRPRWSAGVHGSQSDLESIRNLVGYRARLWISGHDHNMQEIYRKKIYQLVSGAGGRDLTPYNADFSGLRFASSSSDGALRLFLHRGKRGKRTASWRFVSAGGDTKHSAQTTCWRK